MEVATRCSKSVRAVVFGAFAATLLAPDPAIAGNGRVVEDGSLGLIELEVYNDPFSGASMAEVRAAFSEASRILWDATDGHFRIGTVTFVPYGIAVGADIEVVSNQVMGAITMDPFPGIGRANRYISLGWQSTGTTTPRSYVLAHELGHYVFGLHDEYEIGNDATCKPDSTAPDAPFGKCVENDVDINPEKYCLMQSTRHLYDHDGNSETADVEVAEFCVAANHDLEEENFCAYDEDVGAWYSKRTMQTFRNGGSCWDTIAREYPFVIVPAGLPQPNPPEGFEPPAFVDRRNEAIVLLMDRSGSMAFNTEDDWGEVCENGQDEDLDGLVDETDDCTQPRIDYLKGAARLYLEELASEQGASHKVGVISFSDQVSVDEGVVALSSNGAALRAAIDALQPAGLTAIGDGLEAAESEASGVIGDYSRRVVLFSDGVWNSGDDPIDRAWDLARRGIAVDTIGAGEAIDSDLLAQIAEITGGSFEPLDASASPASLQPLALGPTAPAGAGSPASYSFRRNPDTLAATFLNLWARTKGVSIVPEQRYHTNVLSSPGVVPLHEIPAEGWFTGADGLDSIPHGAETNRVRFRIAPQTASFTAVLAGDIPVPQKHFGVSATLIAPNGTIRTLSNPGPGASVDLDPFWARIHVGNPEPGEWTLEIRSGSAAPEQTGHLTVVARNPLQKLVLHVAPRLPTVADAVEVSVDPRYVSTIRDNAMLNLRVTDPSGGVQSVPIGKDGHGNFKATISNLEYRGSYQLAVIAETDCGSWRSPLEFSNEVGPVAVPELQMGAIETFFVVDGKDIAPTSRQEE